MQTTYQTTGAVSKGARYRIAYNFKANYSYIIYVTCAAVENTVGSNTGPYIRLDVNNNGGGGSTGCNGPETLTPNTGGNPAAVQLSSNSFQEFQFVFPALGTQPTLEVTAFPATNGGTKTVRIRKIRIVETPPAASFSMSSSITSMSCGVTTPVTFTINNNAGTTGITDYTWNLGATPNGWLYNGNPAPASIPITATSLFPLALTPACGKTLGNVSATVTANGNNYNTSNSANVSLTPPSLTISGNASFCSGTSVYSISGTIPCNATVTWSANPTGIISLSPSGNSVTATKIGNGLVTLTATINACSNFSTNIGISVGTPPPAYGIYSIGGTTNFCTGQYYGFELLGPVGDPLGFTWIDYGPTQTTYYYNQGDQIQLSFSEAGTHTIACLASNSCGQASAVTTSVGVAFCGGRFAVTPNPSDGNIKISPINNPASKTNTKPLEVQAIEIVDKLGAIKYRQNFGKGLTTVNISASQLPNDVYTLRIFDGQKWYSHKIVIQR